MTTVNASVYQTVSGGRYNFNNLSTLEPKMRTFITWITRNEQILYNWRTAVFFAFNEKVVLDREKGTLCFTDGGDASKTEGEDWIGFESTFLHETLKSVFTGEWGPTSTDDIVRMEMSGIAVEIIGAQEYGPNDPDDFMKDLRARIKS